MMRIGLVGLAGALGASALVAASACKQAEPGAGAPGPAPSPVTFTLARATRGSIGRTVTIPATVRPRDQAVLYAKVSGYLKNIRVDKGDQVRAGDLVAEIEAPELQADLVRQKAEVAVADVSYRRIRDAHDKAPDLVMPQTLDDAKGRFDMAKAGLDRTATLLAYTKIRAPFSGIVAKRSVDPGAFIAAATAGSVAPNAALLTLIDIRSVRIEIPVPEPEVPRVRVGLPVLVTADELSGTGFEGKITRFAYALDEASKTMLAEAEIPNPGMVLRPGMYVRARIDIDSRPDALLVPVGAIVPGRGQDWVFTVVDGKAKRVTVKIGFRDNTNVEIVDGLASDQAVIVAGANPPTDGQAVRVAGTP